MSCGHYDPQPAEFISQTDEEDVSARVFAYLFSVPCTDSIPGIPAGWFVGNRGWMRAARPYRDSMGENS